MILDLSNVLSETHRTIETKVPVEMQNFESMNGKFPVKEADQLEIKVEHIKGKELRIQGKGRVILAVPCDRCLEPVDTEISLEFDRHVDLSIPDGEQGEELDETNYIDGYTLDVEKLLHNEILVGWPTKILCKEDCKGICNICGQNLNQGTCSCEDTSLDPRMSVIRDVFKNFKEV